MGTKQAGGLQAAATARVTTEHQVTIAEDVLAAAGLRPGDVLTVRAVGPGRVELTRLDELFARHRGGVTGGAGIREVVDQLREEWL